MSLQPRGRDRRRFLAQQKEPIMPTTFRHRLRSRCGDAMRLLFPLSCPACEAEQPFGQSASREDSMWTRDGWCTACRQRLDAGNRPRCDRCAAVLAQPSPYSIGCATCYDQTLPFAGVISVGNYEGLLQQLVTQAKNQHDETLTGQLGRLLADEVTRHRLAPEIDLAVTIPSHWLRQLRNGFHAAWLIAQNVQKITGIRQSQRILRSVKPTEKQGTLSRTGRAANVRGAFECRRPESVTDKTVLLVDDVMTSGATLCEATRVLQKAGARKVIVGVLARATVAA